MKRTIKFLGIGIVLALLIIFNISKQKSASNNELLAAARNYVTQNSVAGLVFDLTLVKQLNRWALVEVVSPDADRAAVVLEKVGNRWVVRDFGTIFPEMEKQVPELFK